MKKEKEIEWITDDSPCKCDEYVGCSGDWFRCKNCNGVLHDENVISQYELNALNGME